MAGIQKQTVLENIENFLPGAHNSKKVSVTYRPNRLHPVRC